MLELGRGLRGMLLVFALVAMAPPLLADEAPSAGEVPPGAGVPVTEEPPTVAAEEVELTGAELKAHKKAVKAMLRSIHKEKNRETVRLRIARMGTSGTRVERDTLIAFATKNKNHAFVSHSFHALRKVGGKVSIDFMCGANGLRHKSFLIALSAAEALGMAKDPTAAPHLLDVMLHKRTKIEVVSACAIAAAKCAPSDDRVIETLMEQSRHRKDTIRSNTLEALGHLGSDAAVARLTEALQEDKLARARGAAATGLGWTGRAEVIPVLEAAMRAENAQQVVRCASDAIQVLRGGRR